MSLSRRLLHLLPLVALIAASTAWSEPAGLRVPVRLTAGGSDELLGVRAADRTLFFVSNKNATAQIFSQTAAGTPHLLFEEGADATFPRPNPEGTLLAYITTRHDAAGDLCLRSASGTGRVCLTGPETADLLAFWFPDGASLGVVQRRGMHGDSVLQRIDLQGKDLGPVVPAVGISNPALHPDGKWLVWVPVERASADVGVAFAVKPAAHLRLGQVGAANFTDVELSLPGVSGFPAFSADGRFLYFSQHLSDTNADGRIDGHDHSVLFRLPFDPTAATPLGRARPEQLTSAHWDCQYPAPAADALLTTCHVDGSLDVYALPLDGAVSAAWSEAQLREVLDASRDPWQQLLVLSHLLARVTADADKVELQREMARIHMALGELASAEFHMQRAVLRSPKDPVLRGELAAVLEWIGYRQDERRLAGGKLDDRFLTVQRDRLRRLGRLAGQGPPAVRDLALVMQIDILSVMGEQGRAAGLLERLDVRKMTGALVLHVYADRALPVLQTLGHTDKRLQALAQLADHAELSATERLDFAERFVAALKSGVGPAERASRVSAWLAKADPAGELGFRLQLEAHLLTLTRDSGDPLRELLFTLYKRNDPPERRRALVAAIARRAAEVDNAYLLYQFANSWVSQVPPEAADRQPAVDLYRQVGLDKAWIHQADAKIADARGTFWGLTLQTDDVEAHVGFVEARLAEGKADVAEVYAKRFPPDHPIRHFVDAWLLARALATMTDVDARRQAMNTAETHALAAVGGLPQSVGLTQLRGWLRHERFVLDGDRQAGVEALDHNDMALDLARGRPRYLAPILSNIGLLQSELGNHALALRALDVRRQYPSRGPAEDLALRLARVRSLHHLGRAEEATVVAEDALRLAEAESTLEPWRALTRDRAALVAYAAGRSDKALAHVSVLLAQPIRSGDARLDLANQMRWTLLAAAAAERSGQPQQALAHLESAEQQLSALDPGDLLRGSPPTARTVQMDKATLARIIHGIRAEAARAVHDDPLARLALSERLVSLSTAHTQDVEDTDVLLEIAATHYRLAVLDRDAGDLAAAVVQLEAGLASANAHASQSGSVATDVRIDLLRAYAEGVVSGKLTPGPAQAAFLQSLREVHTFLCARNNPARQHERFLFGLYLSFFDLAAPARSTGVQP